MVWPIRVIEYTKETNGNTLHVGDAFYFTPPPEYDENSLDDEGWYWPAHFTHEKRLSEHYKTQHQARRPPILIFLPGRTLFCVDGACWRTDPNNRIEYYGGWAVSGDLPLITLSPSINIVGSYHGFIRDGIVTDDCEGRKYTPEGWQLRAP